MEIAIVGVAVSLLVQWLKKQFGTNEYMTLVVVLAISLIAAGVYTYLIAAGYWESVLAVLLTAGSFYTFILARFK